MRKTFGFLAVAALLFTSCGGTSTGNATSDNDTLADTWKGALPELAWGGTFIDYSRAVEVGGRLFPELDLPDEVSTGLTQARYAGAPPIGIVYDYAILLLEQKLTPEFGFAPEDIVTMAASFNGRTTFLVVRGPNWETRLVPAGWTQDPDSGIFGHPDQSYEIKVNGNEALISRDFSAEPEAGFVDQGLANDALEYFVSQGVYGFYLVDYVARTGSTTTDGVLPMPVVVGAGIRAADDELQTVVQVGYASADDAKDAAQDLGLIIAELSDEDDLYAAEINASGNFVRLTLASGTISECQADPAACQPDLWVKFAKIGTLLDLLTQ